MLNACNTSVGQGLPPSPHPYPPLLSHLHSGHPIYLAAVFRVTQIAPAQVQEALVAQSCVGL